MSAIWHPCFDEYGQPVQILNPSTATNVMQIANVDQVVTFVPNSPVPYDLNGVRFESWIDAPNSLDGWANVCGQANLIEPSLILRSRKKAAAGVVIEESDGRVWAVSPTNAFGGYQQTFPKGKADKGLPLQAVAIKECFEESGLQIEIKGLLGDFERSTSITRYYVARRIGGTPADVGWESQAVHLIPREKLIEMLNSSEDHKIVVRFIKMMQF